MNNIEKILENVPDKQLRWKGTTSLKWKEDMLNFFSDLRIENGIEIGTNQGWTSYILSFICKNVYTVELSKHNYEQAQKHCSSRNNINFVLGNAYIDSTYSSVPEYMDLCVVDCIHTYNAVNEDIARCINYAQPSKELYIVFDDYSHPESTGVKQAIDEFVNKNNNVSLEKYIGHSEGHVITRSNGTSFTLIGPEGVILKYKNEN